MSWLFDDPKPTGQGARRGHWETINPRKVKLDHQPKSREAVRYYKRNPGGTFDESMRGVPFVRRGRVLNGNHRVQAARETGRKIRVWVEDS